MTVVADVLESQQPASGRPRELPQLVEVVAYLGGALVLAAGVLFVFEQWGQLGFGAQVALLAISTGTLFVAGVVVARVPALGPDMRDPVNDARRRLAGSLITAAGLSAGILVLTLGEKVTADLGRVDWSSVLAGVVLLVLGAFGYRMAPTVLGLVGTIGGAVVATTSLVDGVQAYDVVAGIALMLLGLLWLTLTERGWFHESTASRSLGVVVALVGAQLPVMGGGGHAWLGYLMTLGVVVAGIVLYLRTLVWPYLAVAVIGVTLVVPEALGDWTGGSLGAVGGVLVTGITLLVASFAGYRLRAEVTE